MSSRSLTRHVDGILLVDKPPGLTSNAVLQQVKRLFNANKAGHTGSLDPMATGMLPICFGEATKFCQYLLDADKCYEATGLLGIKTTTGDAMGEVIAQAGSFTISEHALQTVLSQFLGRIKQTPSMFSALKHQGKPLYKYARAGLNIPREPRDIVIEQLELTQFDGLSFSVTVRCSKGTYIRNLVEDIGEALSVGAHVTRLHRRYTAGFEKQPMFSIDTLIELSDELRLSKLLPMELAVGYLPRIDLTTESVNALRQGKVVSDMDITPREGCVRLYDNKHIFVGLGQWDGTGSLRVKRLLSERVF